VAGRVTAPGDCLKRLVRAGLALGHAAARSCGTLSKVLWESGGQHARRLPGDAFAANGKIQVVTGIERGVAEGVFEPRRSVATASSWAAVASGCVESGGLPCGGLAYSAAGYVAARTTSISGGSQPPMPFDLALSKTAGDRPLDALVGPD